MRKPAPVKRLRYHWLSALLGWNRSQSQAISTIIALTRRLPALITLAVPAGVGRADQAGEGGQFAPIAKRSPTEELHYQEPSARRADRPQMHQLNDALLGFGSGALQPLATLGFELLHLTLNER